MLKPNGRAITVSTESVEPLKRISCLRCQQRKIKCTRRYPCSNCTQASQECKFRDHDVKRRPVSSQYVLALENRIAWFESFVESLKGASNEERENMLRGVQFQDHLPKLPLADNGNQTIEETSPLEKERTMSLQTNSHGSLLYHGPTSMYQEEIYPQGKVLLRNHPTRTRDNKPRSRKHFPDLELEDGFVNEALSLFFASQYPQFMFVYREAFLKDYFDHQSDGKYWSYPLLYAICVLGAAISPKQKMRDKCGEISTRAQSMIVVDELENPHITTVQALLCLAFYEIGNGNHSKGWSLSGMAFRIGQELGFQQDPKLWADEDKACDTKEDREIRRRIYWGCYVADKLISLYLGRPIFLHEEDANVNPTEPLPDFPVTHTWFGLSDQLKSAASLKLVVTFRCMIDLRDPSIREGLRSSRLSSLNTSLCRWYSALPAELLLKPSPNSVQSHVAMVHVLYHSILISLNRHFIRPSPGFPSVLQARGISEFSADSIITLLRQLRAQGNLRNSPIIFVYAAVMAGSAILLLKPEFSAIAVEEPRLSFVLKVLDECSWTYKIAAEAKIRVQNSLSKCYGSVSAQVADSHTTELSTSSRVLGTSSAHTPSTTLDSENWLPSGQTQDLAADNLPSQFIDESAWFMDSWNNQSGIQDAMFTDVSGDLFGGIWMPLDR